MNKYRAEVLTKQTVEFSATNIKEAEYNFRAEMKKRFKDKNNYLLLTIEEVENE